MGAFLFFKYYLPIQNVIKTKIIIKFINLFEKTKLRD